MFWLLISIQMALTTFLACWYSPTLDEAAHLPAGLSIWRFGTTDLYRVNPPLVRAVAAMPLLLIPHDEDWSHYVPGAARRAEWDVGADFIVANDQWSLWLYTFGRWMCLPFSLLGLTVCWCWGKELSGNRGAALAGSLWCFCPNLIGHGALITNDVAATSLGLLAAWRFHRWIQTDDWADAFYAGTCLGAALLSKTYWIILLGLWPIMALCLLIVGRRHRGMIAIQMTVIMLIGLMILNLGYGYEGTGTSLGDFQFYSRALSGEHHELESGNPGNRFQFTVWGRIPLPLPRDYVTGIDLQKHDLERPHVNFLFGRYRQGGWWWYYLIGLCVKVPLGTLFLTGAGLWAVCRNESARRSVVNLLPLAIPVLTLFLLVSSETGMNRHFRYVFPVLPLLFLVAAQAVSLGRRGIVAIPLAATVCASLIAFPDSLSFFNVAGGGVPNRGTALIDSNLDWGQDLLRVRDWMDAYPERRPVVLAPVAGYPVSAIGIDATFPKAGPLSEGWHLISVHLLVARENSYSQYRKLQPIGRVGSTINIYHVPELEFRDEHDILLKSPTPFRSP